MIQIPASSPWVAVRRWQKVTSLCGAIDGALLGMKVDPFSPAALAYVEAMSAEAWRIACEHARCRPASVETRSAVIDLYAERCARLA